MPKIPQQILESVFFLYANAENAREGINAGGTGFVVAINEFSEKK